MTIARASQTSAADQPLLITGSGRGGTTWVLDVLAATAGFRTVFEPLHPVALPAAAKFSNRYLHAGSEAPELERLLGSAFDGSLHSVWTDYRVRPDRLRPTVAKLTSAKKTYKMLRRWKKLNRHYWRYRKTVSRPRVIVKAIRANLMLSWIRRRFDARTLLVLRHPGAIVESQHRLGGKDWAPTGNLAGFRADTALLDAHGGRYGDLLEADLSPVESLTLVWCIQNQIPLEELGSNGAKLVFYEQLFTSPEEEWGRALEALGLRGEPDWSVVAKPSEQSSSLFRAGPKVDASHIGRWLERLKPSVLSEIDGILRRLGVTIYAADDPLPIQSAVPKPAGPDRA